MPWNDLLQFSLFNENVSKLGIAELTRQHDIDTSYLIPNLDIPPVAGVLDELYSAQLSQLSVLDVPARQAT
jgi:hypothetical protein